MLTVATPTVLITGATGLFGTWLRRTAPSSIDVVGLTHRTPLDDVPHVVGDLRDADATTAAVARARPSLVVHAAYAKDAASIVGATEHVVAAAAQVGADVLFVSTDAVFGGDGRRRAEHEEPDPVSDYGRWKARAERIVADRSDGATIIRLPLIVSLDPADHVVARIRADADHGDAHTWFTDEYRQPASAADLSAAIWRIAALDRDARAGPWHLPGPESLSRYEIAQRVAGALGLDDRSIRPGTSPHTPDRPRHLDLDDARARAAIGWSPAPVLV